MRKAAVAAAGVGVAALLAVGAQIGPDSPPTPACAVHGLLPDHSCTPGAVQTTSLHVVCHGNTQARRNVTTATKDKVRVLYGAPHRATPGSFEVDHLIPIELGGANSVTNLWPEAAPGYHQKDLVENRLHDLVCAGRVPLLAAQHDIAADWVAAATKYGVTP